MRDPREVEVVEDLLRHARKRLAVPVEPAAEVPASEPPRGDVMAHGDQGIVQAPVSAQALEPVEDLVVFPGDQRVVHLSQVGPPAADVDERLPAEGEVRADGESLALLVGQVRHSLVAVIEDRERPPNLVRSWQQQFGRRLLAPTGQDLAEGEGDLIRPKGVHDAVQPGRLRPDVVVGMGNHVAARHLQAAIQREALSLPRFECVANRE